VDPLVVANAHEVLVDLAANLAAEPLEDGRAFDLPLVEPLQVLAVELVLEALEGEGVVEDLDVGDAAAGVGSVAPCPLSSLPLWSSLARAGAATSPSASAPPPSTFAELPKKVRLEVRRWCAS
jgi:hypothetical protein